MRDSTLRGQRTSDQEDAQPDARTHAGTHVPPLTFRKAAAKMTTDLRDKRILKQARHNVFLSQVLAKDKGKSLFHFFGRNFPLNGWFRFSTLLRRFGFLNTEVVQETPMEDPMGELERLMRFVVELFFEYVNADGKSVDFEALRTSPRWRAFNEAVCQLQVR